MKDKGNNIILLQEILLNTTYHIDELHKTIDVLAIRDGKNKTMLSFLIRERQLFEAAYLLLEGYNTNQKLRFPILLLLRTGVLDFITLSYLLNIHDKSDFSNAIKSLDRKIVKRLYKNVCSADSGYSVAENKKHLELLVSAFPDQFINTTSKLRDGIKPLEPTELAGILKTEMLKDYKYAYDIYSLLSVFEHYQSAGDSFLNQSIIDAFENFIIGSILMITGVSFIFNYFNAPEDLKQKIRTELFKFDQFQQKD